MSKQEWSMHRSIRWMTVLLWVTVIILIVTLYFSFRAAVDVAAGAEVQSQINEQLISQNQEVLQQLLCITTLVNQTEQSVDECLEGGRRE